MTIIRRTDDFFPALSQMFDGFFHDFGTERFAKAPAVNVKETEAAFTVEVAAPGLQKEDFKIALDNNVLSISSEKKTENNESHDEGKYTRREFSYQSFKRSFTVPETIDTQKIEAKYEQGVLHLILPKKEEVKQKPVRTIEIA